MGCCASTRNTAEDADEENPRTATSKRLDQPACDSPTKDVASPVDESGQGAVAADQDGRTRSGEGGRTDSPVRGQQPNPLTASANNNNNRKNSATGDDAKGKVESNNLDGANQDGGATPPQPAAGGSGSGRGTGAVAAGGATAAAAGTGAPQPSPPPQQQSETPRRELPSDADPASGGAGAGAASGAPAPRAAAAAAQPAPQSAQEITSPKQAGEGEGEGGGEEARQARQAQEAREKDTPARSEQLVASRRDEAFSQGDHSTRDVTSVSAVRDTSMREEKVYDERKLRLRRWFDGIPPSPVKTGLSAGGQPDHLALTAENIEKNRYLLQKIARAHFEESLGNAGQHSFRARTPVHSSSLRQGGELHTSMAALPSGRIDRSEGGGGQGKGASFPNTPQAQG